MSDKHPTHDLAYFFWHDIQGNDGSYSDAFQDPTFKRRYLRHAKLALKDGFDIDVVKKALTLMKNDGVTPPSPQSTIDWSRRGYGKSYYECAQDVIEEESKAPPIWDAWNYLRYLQRNSPDDIRQYLSGRSEDNRVFNHEGGVPG